MTTSSYVYHGDNMDILPLLPDKCIDWAVIDFQYGIGVDTMGYTRTQDHFIKQNNGSLKNVKRPDYIKSEWDKVPPSQAYFDQLVRVSNNQIMFGIDYVNWTGVGPGRIRWDKMVAEGMSFNRYEVAYCYAIDHVHEIQLLHSGMMQAKSIKEPTVMQGNKRLNEKKIHKTQKPVLLYDILLRDFIEPGSLILDTHVGSGSLRISADKYGCDFIGCEINHHNYWSEQKRFNTYKQQMKLQLF